MWSPLILSWRRKRRRSQVRKEEVTEELERGRGKHSKAHWLQVSYFLPFHIKTILFAQCPCHFDVDSVSTILSITLCPSKLVNWEKLGPSYWAPQTMKCVVLGCLRRTQEIALTQPGTAIPTHGTANQPFHSPCASPPGNSSFVLQSCPKLSEYPAKQNNPWQVDPCSASFLSSTKFNSLYSCSGRAGHWFCFTSRSCWVGKIREMGKRRCWMCKNPNPQTKPLPILRGFKGIAKSAMH